MPHVAARRIGSRAEAQPSSSRRSAGAACSKVLLIGGDEPEPVGPYADGAALLRRTSCRARHAQSACRATPRATRASPGELRRLAEKLALRRAHGLGTYVVTQFSFAPAASSTTAPDGAQCPRHAGLRRSGRPDQPRVLLRFAQHCGVSASLRALQAQGMGAVRLFTHTDPADQLAALARYCRTGGAATWSACTCSPSAASAATAAG